jgi:hypothetical protein
MTDSPEKRPAKAFEPPPWERERFEELRREREAQLAQERPAEPGAATADAARRAEPEAPRRTLPPDSHIETMLIQLGAQEPKVRHEVWRVSAAAAVVLGILGTAMLMYALVGLLKTLGTGIAGPFGSGVVAALGLLMIAGAIWSGMRSSRQKQGEL